MTKTGLITLWINMLCCSVVAQDMTTLHIDHNSAIHTARDSLGRETRDPMTWADNDDPLHVQLHFHAVYNGKTYCVDCDFLVEANEKTRKEVADMIASEFQEDLRDQGLNADQAKEVASAHGASVLVEETPRDSQPNETGTSDNPIKTGTAPKGKGPKIVQFTEGPDGK